MLAPASFRQFMSCFATGITVVTVQDKEKNAVGITINSITSVSLEPPLILFCLDKKAKLYPVFRDADMFAVNILSQAQQDISRHFADYKRYPEPKKIWDKPRGGCPILKHTLGWMVCRKTTSYKGGDHMIFLGQVTELKRHSTQLDPLLYFHSRYREIGE